MIEQREGETTLKVKNHLDNMVTNTQHILNWISLFMYNIIFKIQYNCTQIILIFKKILHVIEIVTLQCMERKLNCRS